MGKCLYQLLAKPKVKETFGLGVYCVITSYLRQTQKTNAFAFQAEY